MLENDREGLERLLQLFNIEAKKDVQKYCRDLVIRSEDLTNIVLAGSVEGLQPYKYACHFAQISPEHLNPTERDLAALAANGVGQMSRAVWFSVSLLFLFFFVCRLFSVLLF